MKKSSVFEWYKWFTEGEGMVEDTEKTRSSQKSHILRKCLKVRHLIPSDGRLNIREVVQERNLDKKRRENLRDDLCMKNVSPRWSPILLTDEEKRRGVESVFRFNCGTAEQCFVKMITGDETRRFQYDPERTR